MTQSFFLSVSAALLLALTGCGGGDNADSAFLDSLLTEEEISNNSSGASSAATVLFSSN
jgi:hypothetical protein